MERAKNGSKRVRFLTGLLELRAPGCRLVARTCYLRPGGLGGQKCRRTGGAGAGSTWIKA